MGRKLTIDKAPAWVMDLEGKMKKAAMRGLLSAGHRVVAHIVNDIIPHEPRVPVDRGIYRAGWRVRKVADGVLVYNATPAAGIIEDGARAENIKIGRAMIEALTAWIIRKGLIKTVKTRDDAGRFTNAKRDADARQMAWAIAQSMKKKGIFNKGQGLKILARARKRIPEFLEEEVRREIAAMPK